VLPSELQYQSARVQAYQPIETKQTRQHIVDFLKESRDINIARSARYEQTFWQYHARRVHPCAFHVGDLV
jgi:hypothetical protein